MIATLVGFGLLNHIIANPMAIDQVVLTHPPSSDSMLYNLRLPHVADFLKHELPI
jgi:hypothetical protein